MTDSSVGLMNVSVQRGLTFSGVDIGGGIEAQAGTQAGLRGGIPPKRTLEAARMMMMRAFGCDFTVLS